MCRFTAYLGPPVTLETLITRPSHSLIHQSFESREREEPLNGDGFGVSWYVPEIHPEPGRFRSITPAWNNCNLLQLAPVTRSGCIFAHVRAASPGLGVTETNCHPFVSKRYSFMHNGLVGGFAKIRRALLRDLSDAAFHTIRGTTDTEHVFAMLLDQIECAAGASHIERMATAMRKTTQRLYQLIAQAGVDALSTLNFALTDGERMVATRLTDGTADEANTLYLHTGRRYVCEEGLCRMVEPDERGPAVLVSSEPLSSDPGWQAVPVNHMVVIDSDHQVEVQPF